MQTICDREDVPQAVKDAVARWYTGGHARFDVIVRELENMDEQ